MVSSTESAMTSRDASDDFMPACPIAMPSVTVMVANSRGVPRAAATPCLTACAWRISEMLHGAASFQAVATPMIGWWICSVVSPIAYRYERCGARSGPSVTCRLGSRDLSTYLLFIVPFSQALLRFRALQKKRFYPRGPLRAQGRNRPVWYAGIAADLVVYTVLF